MSQLSMTDEKLEQSVAIPRAKSISPSKSIDFTRLEDFGIDMSTFMRPSLRDSAIISARYFCI